MSHASPRGPLRGCYGRPWAILPLIALLALPAPGFARRPALFRVALQPTGTVPSAQGVALLAPAQSPFGLALTPDGHFIFDVSLTASGLPSPSALGPYTTFVAWAVSDDLVQSHLLGALSGDKPVIGQVSFNKFLVIVSAESGAPGDRWKGPIVLRGFAPSALLDNFSGKTMFNGGMPP